MSFLNIKYIDMKTCFEELEQQRKNHWEKLFDKYSNEKENSEDHSVSVIDIVKRYGKSKRFGKCTKANNVEIYNKKRGRCKGAVYSTKKVFCSKIKGKRGRPQLKCNENTESDSEEASKLFTNLEENVSKSETSRKRGRPPKTKIKIEEVAGSDIDEVNNKKAKSRNDNMNTETNVQEEWKPVEKNVVKPEMTRKRGRPPKTKIKIEEVAGSDIDEVNNKKAKSRNGNMNTETNVQEEWKPVEKNVVKPEMTRKRGRPPKTKIKIEEVAGSDIDEVNNKKAKSRNGNMSTETNVQEEWKPVEKNVVKPEMTRKRGRPSKQNNTDLKLEVQASDTQEINNKTLNKRRGRPCLKPNIEHTDESEYKTHIENGMKSTSEITRNMAARKRGRPCKNDNVAKNHNASALKFPEKQLEEKSFEKKINTASIKTSTNTHLNRNIKKKSSSITFEKCLVYSKELEKEYPDLVDTETKHSRSFTEVPKFEKCYLLRSKTWSDYSDNSFKLLHQFFYKNKNRNSAAKEKSPKKLLHSSPRKMPHRSEHYDKTLKPTVDNKGNHEKKSLKNSSQFNTTHLQPVVDSDLLHTKFIIEEKLKSNLGLLTIRRYYNRQLAAEGKDNNFTFSHNAVKSELIKVKKIISLEKIEQYMQWFMSIWISQANNGNNHSKMGNASKDSMPTT